MLEKDKPQVSNEEIAFEKIDQAKEKVDTFSELVGEISAYVKSDQVDIKSRLAIERKLKKYQEQNVQHWLFNIILKVVENIKK